MDLRIIHSYDRLVDEGLAPPITCGNDKQHPRPLVSLTKDGDVELWCLACSWRMKPGIGMYESMERIVYMNWDMINARESGKSDSASSDEGQTQV